MVFWSGVFEVIGGVGLLFSFTKDIAGWGLIALLIAVFPANINMFWKGFKKKGVSWFTLLTLLRLPIQLWLIYWVFKSVDLSF